MDKVAESVPEIDQVKDAPASGSVPKNVLTAVWRSFLLKLYVGSDEFVLILGASFTLVTVMVTV